MGLFGGKKETPGQPPSGATPKPTVDVPRPPSLLPPPPSARPPVAPPMVPPAAPPAFPNPNTGPTPPGGMLPTPSWHREFEEARAAGTPPPGTISRAQVGPTPRPPLRDEEAVIEAVSETGEISIRQLLREAVERGASDLHLSRGVPPTIRLDGYLVPLKYPPLSRDLCERLVLAILNPTQRERFEQTWELDLSLDLPEVGRFRVNVHRQRSGIEGAFRIVNDVIMPLRRLGLPGIVEEIGRKHSGLVLVTGPTGSGKSTTLAAMIDQINSERQCMIVTVEDPIEYVHSNKRSIIKQREVSSDTKSFAAALRHVLRQDPDVIVVGEMRDLETISTALTAAETGHLVFATLHTPDASQTIHRIIDVFPPHQQEQARMQVASTLQAIVAQQLIPVPGNRGRVVAVEILIATVAVRKIIRSAKTEQLYTAMQTNWEQGMMTMDKSLKTLHQQGLISFDDAISRCTHPSEFDQI